ncbi:enoyl-CoA hydratase-related protein [Cytophagaceae bacterium DM2B3-1]|uniref:Enoyl-CoA hydratase-related protein n=1 Tax=Xanthocytophaga flava TaxID=3048013 RepID=A0ABT7CQ56_9BACT|nr:enoyl-CoA hydratase-related protein [Xanthocytophaga flavus]MDJ1495878.1 enoyl-CoA hydratase-related protein [Xanthocytophaga flavus]
MFEHILYQNQDGVCSITLNRPEVYNALNVKLTYEIKEAFEQAGQDESVRVVVLSGTGDAFCSGADLKEAATKGIASYSDEVRKRYNPMILAMRNLPKPVIGRINGVAAGAGCSLALACDILVMAEETYLTEAFVGIGLVMDSGSGYFLPRLVGSSKAFELATTGAKISAKEALQLGMVNKIAPVAMLDEVIKAYTGYYTTAPTVAIGLMKKMLNQSFSPSLEEMLEYEAQLQDIAGASKDHREGIVAFMEKRKPVFKGK